MVGTQSTAAIGKGGYKRWEKEDIREGERRGWWIGDCGTRGVRVGLVGMGDAGEEPHGHSTPCPPPPHSLPQETTPSPPPFLLLFFINHLFACSWTLTLQSRVLLLLFAFFLFFFLIIFLIYIFFKLL